MVVVSLVWHAGSEPKVVLTIGSAESARHIATQLRSNTVCKDLTLHGTPRTSTIAL